MNPDSTPSPTSSLPITQWDEADRPREKMRAQGKKSLTNSELIAILLRTGMKGCSAIDLAKNLLSRSGNRLTDLARMEVADLQSHHKGLGLAKAVTVLAALELGNRMLKEEKEGKEDIVADTRDLFYLIAPDIRDLPHEEFWAIYLNQRNKVLWKQRIASGGLTHTTVDLRLLLGTALEHHAVAIAVAHNHPAGSLKPSKPDIDLTKRIKTACEVLELRLIDHIIIGVNDKGQPDYYSFSEDGLL